MTTFDDIVALDAEHVMQTYGRQPGRVRARRGRPAVGQRGQGVPRLPRRARGHVARARAPGRRRRARRAGAHAAARVEPVLQRRAAAGRRAPRRAARRRRSGVLLPTPAPRPTSARSSSPAATGRRTAAASASTCVSAYGSFHGRTLATLAATGQPQKQEVVPAAARRVPPGRVRRPRRPRGRDGRPRVRAVLLEPVQGEGGVNPAPRRLPRGGPRAVRRARGAVDRRRGADRPRPHRQVVRLPARRRRAARRRHHGQGARQRRADRRVLGARRRRGRVQARRPRHHLRRPAARGRAPRSRCSTGWRPRTCPRSRRAPGERLTKALLALAGVADVRGLGLLLAAELEPGIESGPVAAACLDAGLVVNAVTPTALRFAPSLLVTDDEIDEARSRSSTRSSPTRRVMSATSSRSTTSRPTSSPRCSTAAGVEARARPSAAAAGRAGRRAAVREAVGPHPHLHRDGGGAARRPPGLHPARRGRARRARARRGRRPHARLLLRRHRRPGVRPRDARSDGRGGRRAGGEPAVRPRAPVPGARRLAHDARAARRPRRPDASPTSATATTSPRRSPSPPRWSAWSSPVASPPGYELDDDTVERARNLGGADRARRRPVRGGAAAPTSSTPTCGRRWARKTRRPSGAPRSRASRSTTTLMAAAGEQRVPALPARPPGRGGVGRGGRRAAQRGLAAGREPHARRTRAAGGARRRAGEAHADDDARQAPAPAPHRHAPRAAGRLEPGAARRAARADGVVATQATVCRDLEDLGAVKVRIPGGAMAYAIPEHAKEGERARRPSAPGDRRLGGRGRPQRATSSCCARRPGRPTWSARPRPRRAGRHARHRRRRRHDHRGVLRSTPAARSVAAELGGLAGLVDEADEPRRRQRWPKRVVLAYSGGLDTSVAVRWMTRSGASRSIASSRRRRARPPTTTGTRSGTGRSPPARSKPSWSTRKREFADDFVAPGHPRERAVRGPVPAGVGAVAAGHREAPRRGRARARRRRRGPRLHRQGQRPGPLRGVDAGARARPRGARAGARVGHDPRGLDRLRRRATTSRSRCARTTRTRSTTTSGAGPSSAARWRTRGPRRPSRSSAH